MSHAKSKIGRKGPETQCPSCRRRCGRTDCKAPTPHIMFWFIMFAAMNSKVQFLKTKTTPNKKWLRFLKDYSQIMKQRVQCLNGDCRSELVGWHFLWESWVNIGRNTWPSFLYKWCVLHTDLAKPLSLHILTFQKPTLTLLQLWKS